MISIIEQTRNCSNFKDIVKPGMLQTAGRVMTLKKGATLKKINWETMKDKFKKNGFELE